MIKLTITAQAYAAIVESLPPRSALKTPQRGPRGAHYIWLEAQDVAQLTALRRYGEDISDVIVRLAGIEA